MNFNPDNSTQIITSLTPSGSYNKIIFNTDLISTSNILKGFIDLKQDIITSFTNLIGNGGSITGIDYNNITINKPTNFQSDWNSTVINKPNLSVYLTENNAISLYQPKISTYTITGATDGSLSFATGTLTLSMPTNYTSSISISNLISPTSIIYKGAEISSSYLALNGGTLNGNLTINNSATNKIIFNDALQDIKLQLYTGYGLGIQGGTLLYKSVSNHRFMAGATQTMILDASGNLTTAGSINATTNLQENSVNLSSKYATITNLNTKENALTFSSPLNRTINTIGIDLSSYLTTSSASATFQPLLTAGTTLSGVGSNLTFVNYNTLSNLPNLSQYLTSASASTTYLALSGGTLTGSLTINNSATNKIIFNDALGDIKLQLFSGYGLGIQGNTLLYTSFNTHRFMAGATQTMILDGSGNLTTAGSINATTNLQENSVNLSSKYATITNLNTKENALTFSSPLTRTTNTIGIDLSSYLTTSTASTTYLPLSGGTLNGSLTINNSGTNKIIFNDALQDIKIQLFSAYGFGIQGNTLLYTSANTHRFMSGATQTMILDGSGNLTTAGSINATTNLQENGTNLSSKYATITNLNLKENILSFSAPLSKTANTVSINLSSYSTTGTDPNYLLKSGGTMTGSLTISNSTTNKLIFDNALQDIKLQLYNGYGLGIQGGTLLYTSATNHRFMSGATQTMILDGSGNLTTAGSINATTNLQENSVNLSSKYLQLSGGTLTGNLSINASTPVLSIKGSSEGDSAILYLATPYTPSSAFKCAIIAQGVSNWSRSKLHFCLDNTNDNTYPTYNANVANARMTVNYDGNVGIGNTQPFSAYDATNQINTFNTLVLGSVNNTSSGGLIISANIGGSGYRNCLLSYDNNFNFCISDYGNLNNNTNTAKKQLVVNYLSPQGSLVIGSSGYVVMPNGYGTSSDERLKTNIQTIENALDKTLCLRGVEFNDFRIEPERKKIGLIAQEVELIIPEVVRTDDNGIKSIEYQNLVGLLVQAIKELNKKVLDLETILKNNNLY